MIDVKISKPLIQLLHGVSGSGRLGTAQHVTAVSREVDIPYFLGYRLHYNNSNNRKVSLFGSFAPLGG